MCDNRVVLVLFSTASSVVCGCQANPARAVFALVGQAVDADDLKDREPQLIGKGPDAADAMFGRRYDTLKDLHADRQWLVYLVEGAHTTQTRYVVEVKGRNVVRLYKTLQNSAGASDAIRADVLKSRVTGIPPDEAERLLKLAKPQLSARSRRTRRVWHVYDAHQLPELQGARYCVLEFDNANRCVDVRLVGVTAEREVSSAEAGP